MSTSIHRDPYVIANWKMNPETIRKAQSLFRGVKSRASYLHNVTTVLCPPALYLPLLTKDYRGKKVKFGAQDVFWRRDSGSYTGQISSDQIRDAEAEYVIVGHSERRAVGESNEDVKKKVKAGLKGELKVVVCVGEREREDDGDYLSFVADELRTALADAPAPYRENLLIAYEPIWAIGGGPQDAMTPHEMHQMSLFIKKTLRDFYSTELADSIPILYGGSVERSNARELITEAGIDGFLVGHASLDSDHFVDILEIVNEEAKED